MVFNNRHLVAALFMSLAFPATTFAADSSVIVGFHQQPGEAEQELIQRLGGTVDHLYSLIPAIAAKLPEQVLVELRDNPLVAYVEENKTVTTIEPTYTPLMLRPFSAQSVAEEDEYQEAWGVRHIGSKEAHDKGITGREVKVAVIDTGIDYTSEDLDANYRGGYDFIYDDDDPLDDSWNSHGTHIAGIIGAELNGTGVVGVAPGVSLYAVKSLDGGGFGTVDTIVSGIQWAVDNGMDIVNISIAGVDSQVLQEACDAAYEAGVLIVAAAGNTFGGAVASPGNYDSVIAVTGTDQEDQRGFFSALGPEVELAAPGLGIQSTALLGGYSELSGTSQAAAHVTGAAALVLSASVGDVNGDGWEDIQDVRQRLQESAVDLGEAGQDTEYGYGLVNVAEATVVTPPATSITLVRESTWMESMETVPLEGASYQITLQNDSLDAVFILVIENNRLRRDLGTGRLFNDFRQEFPQQITFDLDATDTAFKVIFIPLGNDNDAANVTIQKQSETVNIDE